MRLVETLVDLWQENVLIGAAFAAEKKGEGDTLKINKENPECVFMEV